MTQPLSPMAQGLRVGFDALSYNRSNCNQHTKFKLSERYRSVRDDTEALSAPLSAEDQTVQSMQDASPTKWHRGHTTWFFETFVLRAHCSDYQPFDERFCYLFNSYYESVGPRHTRRQRGTITRPGIDEIAAYRKHVDKAMDELLSNPDSEITSIIELGLQHEQQHQELLLTDIKHVFGANPYAPAYSPPIKYSAEVPALDWMTVRAGIHAVGHQGAGFCFDNEGPQHEALLGGGRIASRPVSVGEYLVFMKDGGYDRAGLWLSDGWSTVKNEAGKRQSTGSSNVMVPGWCEHSTVCCLSMNANQFAM